MHYKNLKIPKFSIQQTEVYQAIAGFGKEIDALRKAMEEQTIKVEVKMRKVDELGVIKDWVNDLVKQTEHDILESNKGDLLLTKYDIQEDITNQILKNNTEFVQREIGNFKLEFDNELQTVHEKIRLVDQEVDKEFEKVTKDMQER